MSHRIIFYFSSNFIWEMEYKYRARPIPQQGWTLEPNHRMPGGHSDPEISMPARKAECPKILLIMSKSSVFASLWRIPRSCKHFFQGQRQDSKLRTGLENILWMIVNFLTNNVGVPSSVNLLARPCFQLYLSFIAYIMTIYLTSVQIYVIACTIENLDFSEFLDAMRACCRQGKHALHKIRVPRAGRHAAKSTPDCPYSLCVVHRWWCHCIMITMTSGGRGWQETNH